jgi:hypothetical protein
MRNSKKSTCKKPTSTVNGVLPASLLDYKKFTVEPNPFPPVA